MVRVRLSDVAKEVGVSTKTVSNVVNSTGWVSEPVRQRVLAAIDELGYRPNLAARHLRGGSSGLLALCVPSLNEPYFAEFACEFVDAAQRQGLTVLVTQSRGTRSMELKMLEAEDMPALDGLVLSPLSITAEDIAARRSRIPLLLIGEHGEKIASDSTVHVGPDNVAAAESATAHLLAHGRRRIAAIGVQTAEYDTATVRFKGYQRALEKARIPIDEDLLLSVPTYNRAEGSAAVEQLIARGIAFDGIFCFNDSMAFGALHTLSMHGIVVPDEVMIVGYDNIEESKYTVPPLTTIDPGITDASELILGLLTAKGDKRTGHITVPHRLVER